MKIPCCIALSAAIIHGTAAEPAPISFPVDSGIIDVTEHGARPNDSGDDTAAIQAALDAHPNGNRIIHLPPGVWIVSDTLRWPDGTGGNEQKRTILQGAGEKHTVIRLPDAAPGFGDSENGKALIWTGSRPAQRFRNAVRDLTIDVGSGNPGAIGLQFNASNQGCVRNVTIRAANDSGKIGLDLGHTDEIGPLLVRDLIVEGFEIGISTKWQVNSNTFERVTLRGQRKYGWWNYHQMVFVRGLTSENAVTAIFNEKDSAGTVTLLDSVIRGLDPGDTVPGIHNQRQMYLRHVEITGYAVAIDHDDKGRDKGDIRRAGLIAEDTSHANVTALFRRVPGGTFATAGAVTRMPIRETPEIPWGDPRRDWASLESFGADPEGKEDASPALQKAVDSGVKTIYLPAAANFRFSSVVEIRGPVERIIGLEGRFVAETGKAVWRLVDGRHPRGLADSPAVIIERCNNSSGGAAVTVSHESRRTLVVSSAIGFDVEGRGAGDIFLDDVCGHLELHHPGQSAWCRQLNSERQGTKCRNRGGRLWILGYKTEKTGTLIETTGGGITEVSGIFLYSNAGWVDGEPAFLIEDSEVTLTGINERNYNRQPVSLWVRETSGGETREMAEIPWVYLSRQPRSGVEDP